MIRYEHPLNERVRTLMRLEDLFARTSYFAAQDAPAEHHASLLAMFEIIEVVGRADLKSDRASGTLLVKAFHREDGVRASGVLDEALDRALDRLRATAGLELVQR